MDCSKNEKMSGESLLTRREKVIKGIIRQYKQSALIKNYMIKNHKNYLKYLVYIFL